MFVEFYNPFRKSTREFWFVQNILQWKGCQDSDRVDLEIGFELSSGSDESQS